MTDSITRVFVPFVEKGKKQDDGTILVRGIATDPTLDSDEQICDPAWLGKAMPKWFKFGNIREQHSNIAAGVATEHVEKDGGIHEIAALVVDAGSVSKVEHGVLKGFSIGISRPRITADKTARGGRIIDGDIVEVSLVDRPANPSAVLSLAKSLSTLAPGTEVSPDDLDGDLVRVETYTDVVVANETVTEPTPPEAGKSSEASTTDPAVSPLTPEQIAKAVTKAQHKADKKAAKKARKTAEAIKSEGTDTPTEPTISDVLAAIGTLGKRVKRLEKNAGKVEGKTDESTAEVVKALTTRLETVEQTAATLPVRTAVKGGASNADDRKATLLAKATEFDAKADNAGRNTTLGKGYSIIADRARTEADTL